MEAAPRLLRSDYASAQFPRKPDPAPRSAQPSTGLVRPALPRVSTTSEFRVSRFRVRLILYSFDLPLTPPVRDNPVLQPAASASYTAPLRIPRSAFPSLATCPRLITITYRVSVTLHATCSVLPNGRIAQRPAPSRCPGSKRPLRLVPDFLIPRFNPVWACPASALPRHLAVGPISDLLVSKFDFCVGCQRTKDFPSHLLAAPRFRTPDDRKRTPPRATVRKQEPAYADLGACSTINIGLPRHYQPALLGGPSAAPHKK